MKKMAIFLAIMLIPFSAFALDTISGNDLNDVTGQAGVSIYTNSIQIVKTGVTTTYTDEEDEANNDYNAVGSNNDFNIVSEATNTKIFFKGVDPLMIDVVDMATLTAYLSNEAGLNSDARDYGETAVMITLPNAIEIVNQGSVKTYYSGSVDDANKMITVTVTGGTTLITHADPNWKFNKYVNYQSNNDFIVYTDLDDSAMTPNTGFGSEYVSVWKNTAKNGQTATAVDYSGGDMGGVVSTWENLGDLTGDHSDQIAILITAHED
jgi:hypothetical protein